MLESKFRKMTMHFCIVFLIFAMLVVFTRTITRQVLIKALGMKNTFTELVFFDNKNLMKNDLDQNIGTDETADSKIEIDWRSKYPFDGNNMKGISTENYKPSINEYLKKYTQIVRVVTSSIDDYTSELLPLYDYWVERYKVYRKSISWNFEFENDPNRVGVMTMQNGALAYQGQYYNKEEIQEIADSLEDFEKFLSDSDISFYYVNLGSKIDPDNKQLSPVNTTLEFTNENADNLLEALNERQINTVDMRLLMKEDGLDWYDSYYVTDHHWTNKTSMWAAGRLANILNQNEGFSIDHKYFDINNYNVTEYDDFWMGGQARAIKYIGCNNEAFSVILPDFDTEFDVEIPTDDYHEQGSYDNVLFDAEHFADILSPDAEKHASNMAYSCMRWNNDPLGIIKNLNETNNDDKKILIMTDSFSWYLATYLACDVGETDLIYPMGFDGSIRAFIRENKPDVVLLMYCERSISPIDWNTHKSSFDMR